MFTNKTRWPLLIVLTLTVTLCGCAALADEGPVQVGMSRNGTSLTLTTGDSLVVALDANPTTGYLWALAPDQGTCLTLVSEPTFEPLSDLVGSGGTQQFTLQAAHAGQQTLQLVYHRPWEQGTPPIKTFAVNVTVQ